jgi:hypothetical protein
MPAHLAFCRLSALAFAIMAVLLARLHVVATSDAH